MNVAESSSSELNVIAILSDTAAIELMSRTLRGSGDRLTVATDLAEGLARVSAHVPDIAFVDVSLGESAGLAVLHHVRALAPGVFVYALTRSDRLELGMQAVALGGAGVLVLPLSGDELLTTLSDVRTRLREKTVRFQLEERARISDRNATLVAQVADIAESRTRREAAERLAEVLLRAGGTSAIVYIPAAEGSRQLLRAAMLGSASGAPAFCEDMELLSYADQHELEVIRMALRREQSGIILLGGLNIPSGGAHPLPLIGLIAAQAATVFALIGAREQSHRGAMKDPSSSAYTFAYFVDVAGREIDMSRRHGRRFSLATVGLEMEPGEAAASDRHAEPTILAAERVLTAVRDTDVLARVDANEFYLLLPETGGPGAHACRRRVLAELAPGPGAEGIGSIVLQTMVGIATFPHDGSDLSQLLRVAKHRADSTQKSVVHRLGLAALSLPDIVDTLIGQIEAPNSRTAGSPEAPSYIELPATDIMGLAVGAVEEALRGGATRVLASQHGGLSIGGAVRAALQQRGENVRFDVVDVGKIHGCQNLEVLTIVAEHAVYLLVGRTEGSIVRAIHAADPLLLDLIVNRLAEAGGLRLVD